MRIELPDAAEGTRRYTVDELMPQCDPSVPLTDEDEAWFDAPPAGREML